MKQHHVSDTTCILALSGLKRQLAERDESISALQEIVCKQKAFVDERDANWQAKLVARDATIAGLVEDMNNQKDFTPGDYAIRLTGLTMERDSQDRLIVVLQARLATCEGALRRVLEKYIAPFSEAITDQLPEVQQAKAALPPREGT